VTWRTDGTFEATGTHSRWVIGWTDDPTRINELLDGWAQPTEQAERLAWSWRLPPGYQFAPTLPVLPWPDAARLEEFIGGFDLEMAAVEAHILECRRRWSGIPVERLIAVRATELEHISPQQPIIHPPLSWRQSQRQTATAFGWVNPKAIVMTADKHWGKFDRRPDNVPMIVRSLLSSSDLRHTLIRGVLLPGATDLISVKRFPGPGGGALYEMASSGSHRIHAARILDLPWLFCAIDYPGLPEEVLVSGWEPSTEVVLGDIWSALLARGLLAGDLDTGMPFGFGIRNVQRLTAGWMLNLPEHACRLNRRYDAIYPGALASIGIPPQAAADPVVWRRWLLGGWSWRRRWRHARADRRR
jgi:hypothetical protein